MWQQGSTHSITPHPTPGDFAHSSTNAQAQYQVDIPGLPLELRTLRQEGSYFLICERADVASQVTRQILLSATLQSRGVLILADGSPNTPGSIEDGLPKHDLRVFHLNNITTKAYKALHKDLERALRPRHRTILLLATEGRFDADLSSNRHYLGEWQKWQRLNGCTLVWVLQSATPGTNLTWQLTHQNDLLAGLVYASAPKEFDGVVWDTAFWRTDRHVSGPSRHYLTRDDHGHLEGAPAAPGATRKQGAEDEPLYLESTVLISLDGLQQEDWHIFEDVDRLYQQARLETRATIVFALKRIEQLESLAARLENLRRERGSPLKLIVIEIGTTLRHVDERYLAERGASWIISSTIRGPRLMRQLQQLRSAILPASIEQLPLPYRTVPPNRIATEDFLLSGEQFFARMLALCTAAGNNVSIGSLIELDPATGITAAQVASQLQLRRTDDTACIFHAQVYIFLSDCPRALVNSVLDRLFVVPFRDIFATHTVYPDTKSIQAHSELMHAAALAEARSDQSSGPAGSVNMKHHQIEPAGPPGFAQEFHPLPARLSGEALS